MIKNNLPNKLNIFFLFLFLFAGITEAKMVEKNLNITIPNCYSVNITAEQTDGVLGDISFVGCNKIDATNFNCNCLNKDNNNFSIIMKTDDAMIRNIRYYDIYLNVKYFETYRKTMSVNVEDGGDYFNSYKNNWVDRDNKIIIKEKPVYINQTVYQDKIIEVPKEVIVFKDRNISVIEYVNVTQYYENTTKIDKLEKYNGYKNLIIFSLVLFLLTIIIYFILRNLPRGI